MTQTLSARRHKQLDSELAAYRRLSLAIARIIEQPT